MSEPMDLDVDVYEPEPMDVDVAEPMDVDMDLYVLFSHFPPLSLLYLLQFPCVCFCARLNALTMWLCHWPSGSLGRCLSSSMSSESIGEKAARRQGDELVTGYGCGYGGVTSPHAV